MIQMPELNPVLKALATMEVQLNEYKRRNDALMAFIVNELFAAGLSSPKKIVRL